MSYLARMNFFTGLLTTAEDWTTEQNYHIEMLKLHNRSFHRPGIIAGVGKGLTVTVAGRTKLRVDPGAALDLLGQGIYLAEECDLDVDQERFSQSQTVIVAIRYAEKCADWVSVTEAADYRGYKRRLAKPEVRVLSKEEWENYALPNETPEDCPVGQDLKNELDHVQAKPRDLWVWLALIQLKPDGGNEELRPAADPDNPGPNEIDLSVRKYAGTAVVRQENMPLAERRTVEQTMRHTRRMFAGLALKYATPSCSDVRQAALMTEHTARTDGLTADTLRSVLWLLHEVQRDVYQEIACTYPALTGQSEYKDYKAAVDDLHRHFSQGSSQSEVLNAQDEVADKAGELAQAVVPVHPPIAVVGPKQVVTTDGSEAAVLLDGANSFAFGGRRIAVYKWDLVRTESAPIVQKIVIEVPDQTDPNQATVTLSVQLLSVPGRDLTYHWHKPESVDPKRVLSEKVVELPASRPVAPVEPAVSGKLAVQDVRVEVPEQTNPEEAMVNLSVDLRAASAGDVEYTYTWIQVQPGQEDPLRIIRREVVETPSAPPLAAPTPPMQPPPAPPVQQPPTQPVQQLPSPPVQPLPTPPAQPQPAPPAEPQPEPPTQPQPGSSPRRQPARVRRSAKPTARHVKELTVETDGDEGTVDLDASQSSATAGHSISWYLWEKIN